LRNCIPTEFNRKPRTLLELDFWKATEFRTFLLYTGPVVLKESLSTAKYVHFLHLSVGILILLSENTSWYEYASSILKRFVEQMPILYTEDFLVYNVHCLNHIADDAIKFGSLNKLSAFPFENFMQVLKNLLRAKNKELSQVIRRVYERQQLFNCSQSSIKKDLRVSNSSRDSGWILKTGEIILVTSISDEIVSYRKFLERKNYFVVPCESSKLGIFEISNPSPLVYTKNKCFLTKKLVILPTLNSTSSFVCFPLL